MSEDVSQLTAQERADRIGCMIKAKIDAGEFKLVGGYIARYAGVCQGCALGALACSLGMNNWPAGADYEMRTFVLAESGGLVSMDDVKQLEMGYEGWTHLQKQDNDLRADPGDPFFQLGRKMSLAHGHRTEDFYANRGLL